MIGLEKWFTENCDYTAKWYMHKQEICLRQCKTPKIPWFCHPMKKSDWLLVNKKKELVN